MSIVNGIISSNEPGDPNSLKTLLAPSSVERDWDWVEPLLLEIEEICQPDWNPEHVKDEIQSGKSQLWTAWNSAFAVTQVKVEPFSAESYLLIWICHVGDMPFGEKDFGLIAQYATDCMCKWVEIWSPRPGMPRHLEGHGFEVTNTVMRRHL